MHALPHTLPHALPTLRRICAYALVADTVSSLQAARIATIVPCDICGHLRYAVPDIVTTRTLLSTLEERYARVITCEDCRERCKLCGRGINATPHHTAPDGRRYHTRCYRNVYGGMPFVNACGHNLSLSVTLSTCAISVVATMSKPVSVELIYYRDGTTRTYAVTIDAHGVLTGAASSPLAPDTIWRLATAYFHSLDEVRVLIAPLTC